MRPNKPFYNSNIPIFDLIIGLTYLPMYLLISVLTIPIDIIGKLYHIIEKVFQKKEPKLPEEFGTIIYEEYCKYYTRKRKLQVVAHTHKYYIEEYDGSTKCNRWDSYKNKDEAIAAVKNISKKYSEINDVDMFSFTCNDYNYEIVVKLIDNQYCIYIKPMLSIAKEYDKTLRYTNLEEATSKAYQLSKTLHRKIDLELRRKVDDMCNDDYNDLPF